MPHDKGWEIVQADVMQWAEEYDGPPFHALLCDPPYEIGMMGRSWDQQGIAFAPATWAALSEHLLPGAWLMAFGSTRGWHRLACAIEDAGFVIQPSVFVEGVGVVETTPLLLWLTGQAFPKASRIDTVLDKRAGAEREVVGHKKAGKTALGQSSGWNSHNNTTRPPITAPTTPLAAAWEGHRYGRQVLRDMACPVVCAQKPWGKNRLDDIVDTGAGALWVDGGRVATGEKLVRPAIQRTADEAIFPLGAGVQVEPGGRWPPNFCVTHFAMTLPTGEVWGCQRVLVPVPCPACGGGGCDGCGGTGQVGRGATERVKGITGGKKPHKNPAPIGTFQEKENRPYFNHADEKGTEPIPRYLCARCCGTGCGSWWLAEEPTPCPECGGAGVWACSVRRLDEQAGDHLSTGHYTRSLERPETPKTFLGQSMGVGDRKGKGKYAGETGGPSRFYPSPDFSHETSEALALGPVRKYQAKPSRAERDAGLEEFAEQDRSTQGRDVVQMIDRKDGKGKVPVNAQIRPTRNSHPTLKSIALTKWLATLLLPPAIYAPRRLLVPFAGTGSEAIGALLAGWEHVTMVEMSADYCDIAKARARFWSGWSERTGETEPKAILKAAKKAQVRIARRAADIGQSQQMGLSL